METDAILQFIAWLVPRIFQHVGLLKAVSELAEQENASPQIRALLRGKIAERQALAESEAAK